MPIKMKELVVVAHPDDEILWFSSILFRGNPDVVCVTSGRDDLDSKIRKDAFVKGMNLLGLKNFVFLDFPDTEERLQINELKIELNKFKKKYNRVYTHGFSGETHNQIHHQDVSYVTHQLFDNVLSVAWNQYPDLINILKPEEYTIKKYIMGTFYYKEYDLLRDAYEISPIEKFSHFSKEASEIFYYGIANFGDNHEFLGSKYSDFWGFENSPYEIERHQMILELVRKANPRNIVEFGSCEGLLTEKLSNIADTSCVEKSDTYRALLKEKGLTIIDLPKTEDYDLSIIAAFLEYVDKPEEFLRNIQSNKILIDIILDSSLDQKLGKIMKNWHLIEDKVIRPRWEKMYWGKKKEKLDVYRLGSHGYLYERK